MAETYRVIRGEYVIVGKEPDGDSIRFRADTPALFDTLHHGDRVKVNLSDGTVQLRFQGIDAPELHYQGEAQPYSRQSRNVLLSAMDFGLILYSNLRVVSAENQAFGAILAKEAERHGRPISYLLWETDAADLTDGELIEINPELLRLTLNHLLLEQGMAYPLFYTSMPLEHCEVFRATAKAARDQAIGFYPQDLTAIFKLIDNESIGPNGQLIFPKLFRRCTDYLHALDQENFTGGLREWMITHSENDPVIVAGDTEVNFASLVTENDHEIGLSAEILDLVFVGD